MNCEKCGDPDTIVTDSRKVAGTVRRRRECVVCGHRYTTVELSQQVVAEKLLQATRAEDIREVMVDRIEGAIEQALRSLGLSQADAPKTPPTHRLMHRLNGKAKENDIES